VSTQSGAANSSCGETPCEARAIADTRGREVTSPIRSLRNTKSYLLGGERVECEHKRPCSTSPPSAESSVHAHSVLCRPANTHLSDTSSLLSGSSVLATQKSRYVFWSPSKTKAALALATELAVALVLRLPFCAARTCSLSLYCSIENGIFRREVSSLGSFSWSHWRVSLRASLGASIRVLYSKVVVHPEFVP
jgi:hypothetical protein